MRTFSVVPAARAELEDAACWYDDQRSDLGSDFLDEVYRTLIAIKEHGEYATAPLERIQHAMVRRAFVRRFPYVVIFVETMTTREVIMIRHERSAPATWRSRL